MSTKRPLNINKHCTHLLANFMVFNFMSCKSMLHDKRKSTLFFEILRRKLKQKERPMTKAKISIRIRKIHIS